MLIRYCSDLHLEGFQHTASAQETRFLPHDLRDPEAILVLAGDICSKMDMLVEFLATVESRFRKVIYVPGNHEYYGSEMCAWNREFRNTARTKLSNVYSAAGTVEYCRIDDVDFIFGTLWADGGKSYREEMNVATAIADFRYIRFDDRNFKVSDMQALHRYQRSDIEHLLDRDLNKTVVVTHHLPSYRLCHPRFGLEHNGGFASDSDHVLNLANYWIHGHTHDSIDVTLGNTRVVANPAGYGRETNRSQYNDFGVKFLEV